MKLSRLGLVAALLSGPASVASAEPSAIGSVEKVQESVVATQAGRTRPLAPSGAVLFRDQMRTGAGARLEAKLEDGTVLTLGEKGKLTVDEFVYRPGQTGGAMTIKVAQGAFLFVGGKVEDPSGGNVVIKTAVGTLGVRGTTVWGGRIDGGYGVLVLDGEVQVKTKRGNVLLRKGQGTMVYADRRGMQAGTWPEDRTNRAVQTISFATAQ